ncbi:branched-chain amino acid ABC transporter substrate-binding protein [Pseudofrankia sp. DC12]|uniref:branched-chain amino acid ABC transporter substrate-binding protein n=1 Tax=Pseudofrankia sp. DC12 TaxID=683315 RepID=UPI000696983D|nr:branched-chain amino acid ABC transporter substrate-binding protein [Pseudofrankia sp. DC12]
MTPDEERPGSDAPAAPPAEPRNAGLGDPGAAPVPASAPGDEHPGYVATGDTALGGEVTNVEAPAGSAPLRRLGRWLSGGPDSQRAGSELVVAGGADGPLVPGWEIAVAGLRQMARWTRRAARATAGWVGRRRGTGRGRALLAALVALLAAVPTGLTIALVELAQDHGGDGVPGAADPQVLRLGVMAPLSGDLGNIGIAVRDAVTLAVDEVNKTDAIPGWKVELVAKDDLSRPDGGAAAAEAFAGDAALIGVVGPLSSTVARVALPVLNTAGVPVVSPSNSAPDLTAQDEPASSRRRPYSRYFRLAGTDALQARTGADYAVGTRHRTRILVIDGGPSYGESLAERFTRDVTAAGADVVASYQVVGDAAAAADVQQVADGIQALSPDLIYTTTGYLFASALRKRMAAAGLSVPLLGTDAMVSARYLDSTGDTAEGDLATDLTVPISRLPAAGAFAAEFLKRWGPVVGGPEQPATPDKDTGAAATPATGADGPDSTPTGQPAATSSAAQLGPDVGVTTASEPPTLAEQRAEMIPALAAYAYDSARALLRAAAVVLPGRLAVDDAARAAIATQVGRGSFAGITGQVSFDAFGDRRDPSSVVYAVLAGRFVPLVIDEP